MKHLSMENPRTGVGSAPWLMPAGMVLPADEAASLKDIPVAELAIRRLRGAAEIGRIAQLRHEIDLAAAASADPQFPHREKKETSWAWSSPSSCTGAR